MSNQEKPSGNIDLKKLEVLTHGNAEMLNEIIQLFIDQTPVQLNELEAAISNNDHKQVKSISHNIKSSFSLMDFHRMDLIKELEQMAINVASMEKIHKIFICLKEETILFINKISEMK